MTDIDSFEAARAAVNGGRTPDDVARDLVQAMTPDERLWCLDGDAPAWAGLGFLGEGGYHKAPFHAARVERLGFPGVSFADGPRGCVIGNATAFPVTMARGATWDPDLEERVGDAIGRELRAAGATLTGAVCVNLLRHPAWGRAQETYGEDPFHVGEMGAALTRGLQQHVLACVKHFACNSMENARFSVDIEVDDVELHEVYLPHFRRIVDEGVAAVMSAYNSVNGEWAGQSHQLLTEILRDEWGFQGFVISDWIFGLRDAATSLAAGLDIEMPYRMVRATNLREALDSGDASWDDVDESVRRVIATLLRFDAVLSRPPAPREVLGAPEHRALAREVAGRSIVLLRNESVDGARVLPLAPTTRIAVIGRLADRVNLGDGGSSDVWDTDCHTVLDGLRATFASVASDSGDDAARAAAVAGAADVAIVVAGYTYLDEGEFIGGEHHSTLGGLFPKADEAEVVERFHAELSELPPTVTPDHLGERPKGFSVGGDRSTLRLPDADVALIRTVAAANPRTIVAIQAGSAVIVSEWIDDVPAVVQSWYGGCRAGDGLADVLVGSVNPSAKLPFSVPADEADLPAFDRDATTFRYDRWHGWRYLRRSGTMPLFPFGFGLSYADFMLDDVDAAVIDDRIRVQGTIRNTSARVGADVVQVYASLPDDDAPERLVGFARIEVDAGSEAPFSIDVPVDRLATRDADARAWRSPAGPHRIQVARHAADPAAVVRTVELGGGQRRESSSSGGVT